MNPYEEKDYQSTSFDMKTWKKVILMIIPYRGLIAALLILNVIIAGFDTLFPFLNKMAIDTFATGTFVESEFIRFGILYFVGIVIQAFNVYGFFWIAGRIEMKFSYKLRKECFHKLNELSFSYFDKTPQGWIIARMTSDVARLSEIVSWSMMDLFWGVSVMIFTTVMMLSVNWKLAMLVLMIVPFLAVISVYFQTRILKSYREVRKANSKITSGFSEGIMGAKTTKTLVLEDDNLEEFKKHTHDMRQSSIHAATLSAIFMPIVVGLGSISTASILWAGGNQVLLGMIEFGTLLMFTQYATQFFEPLRQIARLIAEFQLAQASAERVISLLESEVELDDTPEVKQKYGTVFAPKSENYERIQGNVTFEHVDFWYNEAEPVLNDFNLTVKAGQTIALVGETGSGKSTIINLICRFYEPKRGRILIDGVDYRQRSTGWLHSQLGYVLQAPHLFSGTIKENIRFGKLDATDEEIMNAAKIVHAHEFITSFDEGYDTEVGESGSRLSTGQKQLISFARAVLANPAFYVLDEATASIDTETEKILQNAIEHTMSDKTSFVVAHRLSTIVSADRILVIKKGKIIEDGTHKQLMDLKGYYYRLYTNQFKEDLEKELLKGDIVHAV
ncbi:MAG: ABC transporter ATP-binding protein [Erysipelotrichaceae bacterium]|nr:ABC transporter ATP-binding protein [Erysipelotrichaceae bacterium]